MWAWRTRRYFFRPQLLPSGAAENIHCSWLPVSLVDLPIASAPQGYERSRHTRVKGTDEKRACVGLPVCLHSCGRGPPEQLPTELQPSSVLAFG